jgi:hypothetical protein
MEFKDLLLLLKSSEISGQAIPRVKNVLITKANINVTINHPNDLTKKYIL